MLDLVTLKQDNVTNFQNVTGAFSKYNVVIILANLTDQLID